MQWLSPTLWHSHWDCEGEFRSQEIGRATLRWLRLRLPPRVPESPASFAPLCPRTLELLNEHNHPHPDYSGPDTAKLTASGTRQRIIWPRTGSLDLPKSQRLAVHAGLPDAGEARVYTDIVGEQQNQEDRTSVA